MIIYKLKSLEESTKNKTIDCISDIFIKHIQVGLIIAKKKFSVTKSTNIIINRSERKKKHHFQKNQEMLQFIANFYFKSIER